MDYKLPLISKEQLEIDEAIKAGYNIRAPAVPGAGKSTTKFMIASLNPNLNFLDCTYNARLKLDGREKIEALGLKNVDPHSYHSACCRYYRPGIFTNQGVLELLDDPHSVSNSGTKFQAIFLDEQQDMSPVLFRLSIKIIKELCVPNPIIVALGDDQQTLYTFDGADPLFIELTDQIYTRLSDRKWKTVTMNTSYRVPSVIAEFINTRMLKQNRIKPHREGGTVQYLISPEEPGFLNSLVDKYLGLGYKQSDIFILAGTIRHNRVLAHESNLMVKAGKLIHIPNDDQPLTSKAMMNKIVFGSFHQTKGLENKIVIVYGFDASYVSLTKQDCEVCPNALYVAVTRAKEHLILLHSKGQQPLPFFDMKGLGIEIPPPPECKDTKTKPPCRMSVTDLMRGHSSMFWYELDKEHITCEEVEAINPSEEKISLRPEIKMKKDDIEYYECVSHLYGIAATLLAEFKTNRGCEALKWLKVNLPKSQRIQEMKSDALTAGDFVQIANYLQSYSPASAGYKHQIFQIRGYKWVEGAKFTTAVDRIIKRIAAGECKYETPLKYVHPRMTVVGFADIVKPDQLWEIKMTTAMSVEHRIQLCLYAAMLGGQRELYLYNPLLDKTFRVTLANPTEFIDKIINNRLKFHTKMDIPTFMEMIDVCYDAYIEPKSSVDLDGLDD